MLVKLPMSESGYEDERAEGCVTTCPECGQPVTSVWMKDGTGCLSFPSDYVLVADWVYHTKCWDAVLERCPP